MFRRYITIETLKIYPEDFAKMLLEDSSIALQRQCKKNRFLTCNCHRNLRVNDISNGDITFVNCKFMTDNITNLIL